MVHLRWHDYSRGSTNSRLKLQRVLEVYQLVSLTVHEECWTLDLRHYVNISEPVIYKVLQHVASFLTNDVSD